MRTTVSLKGLTNLALLLLYFVAAACHNRNANIPSEVGRVLDLAEENRAELEKVIAHYQQPEDSLKLQATYFLIANMPGHQTYLGEQRKRFDAIFSIVEDIERSAPIPGNYQFPSIQAKWDSIQLENGVLSVQNLEVIEDYSIINSQLLIENIEFAFESWKLPWSRHLSFDQFCEYVLPYRFYDETLESWRPLFTKKYSWLADSMNGSTDPVRAAEIVNRDIKRWFRFNESFYKYPFAISPQNLLGAKMGKCLDQAGIANFAMRAMGIPVSHESVPSWADRSMGHDFSSVLSKSGNSIDFLGGELQPGKNEFRNVAPKIFRIGYANRYSADSGGKFKKRPISIKNSHFFSDVTKNFVPVSDIEVPVYPELADMDGYVYLCVFDNQNWIPVDIGEIRSAKLHFKDIGRNALYMPAFMGLSSFTPAAPPFILLENGDLRFVAGDTTVREAIRVNRKYPIKGLKAWWLTLMGGGIFEGANDSEFTHPVKLHVVPATINMKFNRATVTYAKPLKYVRYRFPKNKYGSLGELAFYSEIGHEIPLPGRRLKSDRVDSLDLLIAFDGKIDRFIHTPLSNSYDGEWIGLAFDEGRRIFEIGYSPRNDRNGIIRGMKYELLYWNHGWKSFGVKFAENEDELVFENVPSNSLLLLRNLSEGEEERPFLYVADRQQWW